MHKYFIKIPKIVQRIFSSFIWSISTNEKEIYLTFDDGPHPSITPWVLQQLKMYNAKATFFCIGDNVYKYPDVYKQIIEEGHAVGNHTYHHLNGWKANTKKYVDDIKAAAALIKTDLFRPPYGRIKIRQARQIALALPSKHSKIIMWDVLSADFDSSISKEECFCNVIDNYRPGSIIVFHDSEKAFGHLQYVLPRLLKQVTNESYVCKKIE